MSSTKHTAGPWSWQAWGYKPSEKHTLAAPTSARSGGPSTAFPDLGAEVLSIEHSIENPADAYLIAAAPDLLEACEAGAETVCSMLCPSTWRGGEKQPHSGVCIQVRAAIKKAKGET